MQEQLGDELTRLKALSAVNKSIRLEEIEYLENQLVALNDAIMLADVHLEAIRLVVNNH